MAQSERDTVIDENEQTDAVIVPAEEGVLVDTASCGNAVRPVEFCTRDLESIFSQSPKLSVDEEKFASIVSEAIDPEIVGSIIAKIKANRASLKIKHIIIYFACFLLLSQIAYALFPLIRSVEVSDAWDEMNVNSEPYETENLLIKSLMSDLNSDKTIEHSSRMTSEQRIIAFKYRTKNFRKDYSVYLRGYDDYLGKFDELSDHYTDIELKVCYIEGVLKSFPWDKTKIGLKKYSKEIKEHGDEAYAKRDAQLRSAIKRCDDILEALETLKDNKGDAEIVKKRQCIEQQKAQLLMYRWLVENLKESKGKRVGYFPDDKGDTGVEFREAAIKIVNGLTTADVVGCKELYNQCVDILREDAFPFNRIYFDGGTYLGHELENKKYQYK